MSKSRNSFLLLGSIVTVLVMMAFSIFSSCSSSSTGLLVGSLVVEIEATEIKSGKNTLIFMTLLDEEGNPYSNFEGEVSIGTTNENVIISSQDEIMTKFDELGRSTKLITLVNPSTKDQSAHIVVNCGGIEASTLSEVKVITPFYEKGRVIFPHDPANKNIKLLSKIERSIRLGEESLSNPILLGKDMNDNFLVYLLEPTNLIIKVTEDGSLSAIISESDDINTSPGRVIAGKTDPQNNLLYLLKKDDQDNIILVFMDISGNIIKAHKVIGNLKEVVMAYVKDKDMSNYDFEAVGLEILAGKPIIIIREVKEDDHKLSSNRPTMIILSESGEVENLFVVNPPLITSFGMDYWKNTKEASLDYRVSISDNFIYLLWGSGYTRESRIGYMVQKLSKSGKEVSMFTRMIREEPPPLKDEELLTNDYDSPLEGTYVAKSIYADATGVYVRVQVDGKDYVDMYNEEDIYYERYNVTVEIGDSNLIGPDNMLKLPGRIVLASDTGIYIFKST